MTLMEVNGRKTGSTTRDTTCAAEPPPGPATPDENPNRHLTRHPRHHPQLPVARGVPPHVIEACL
jgi:hypothetical protein